MKNYNYSKNKCRCGKEKYKYAKQCQKCYFKTLKGKGNPMYGIHRFGKDNPNYKDGRTLKINYCVDCGIKLNGNKKPKRCGHCASKKRFENPKNNSFYGRKHTEKTKKLISLSHGGSGILNLYYHYSFKFHRIRKEILKRDNFICQFCNKKGNSVHHIDYNKNNNQKNNLILLCRKCHNKTNFNRDYWYSYFTYLMENNKKEVI